MTGKTTFLTTQIEKAVAKHGKDNVMVASFTRAAAHELNSRKLPIPQENIGTLHGLCYRAMGSPEIAETHVETFNKQHPGFAVSKKNLTSKLDEMYVEEDIQTEGDKLLNQLNLHRARCLPVETMGPTLKTFYKAWEIWKMRENLIDFTDMIGLTAQAKEPPPGMPKIGIYDEAQDFNLMQFNLIRHWATFQDYVLIAGDDDQSIYKFSGASPDAFLKPDVPQEQKRILGQSWRLPRKIQEFSLKWIQQVKLRQEKEFKARDEEGEILETPFTFRDSDRVVDLAWKYARDNKTVMILTSCGYMLDQIKTALRKQGMPFHNPYRKSRADWNPLGNFGKQTGGGKISTKDRVLAFLRRDDNNLWSESDLLLWTDIVKIRDVFQKGGKNRLEDLEENNLPGTAAGHVDFLRSVFNDFAFQRAVNRDIVWFRNVLLADKRRVADYPLTVFEHHGETALCDRPKIIISTIHGVKGGEADVCILFPDVSKQGLVEFQKDKDSTIRQFYVGMTRARQTLILGKPTTNMTVRF